MKKVILPVLVLMLFTIVSRAQGIRLGLKAGANLNKISGQSFNDGLICLSCRRFLEIDLNKKWNIQPELLWNQTSSKPSALIPFMPSNKYQSIAGCV